MKNLGIALLIAVYGWIAWTTAQGLYEPLPPPAPSLKLVYSGTGTSTFLPITCKEECDTDMDCQIKYPCGDWYGNPVYDQDMTPDEIQEAYDKCKENIKWERQ